MTLRPEHVEYLTARGVSCAYAEAQGLRSVDRDEAGRLLGRGALHCGGIDIPYDGTTPPYHRIRLDEPDAGARYLCPAGRDVPVYVASDAVSDSSMPLYVVEGPVKALSLAVLNLAAIGLGGTGTTLKPATNGQRSLNETWASIPLRGRRVTIAFDSNRRTNAQVARDEARLALALEGAGAIVFVLDIPGDGNVSVGPDDYIARSGADAFRDLLVAAVPGNPVERLHAITTNGTRARSSRPEHNPRHRKSGARKSKNKNAQKRKGR